MRCEKGPAVFLCVLAAAVICASVTLRSKKNKRERKRKRERQGGLEWMEDCQCAAVLWRGVLRCREITGRRRRSLTFAVHNAVVFVVFRSLPSHIQQPPGAGAQHHRDRALRLLHEDR